MPMFSWLRKLLGRGDAPPTRMVEAAALGKVAPAANATESKKPPTEKLTALLAMLKDKDEEVRCRAIEELRLLADPRAEGSLTEILEQDSEREPADYAILALAALGTRTAVKTLTSALEDRKGDLSTLAIVLGDLRARGAVNGLIELLETGTENQRRHAAVALGKIGDPRGIQPLEMALNDPDEGVREKTEAALQTLRLEAETVREKKSTSHALVRSQRREAVKAREKKEQEALKALKALKEKAREALKEKVGMLNPSSLTICPFCRATVSVRNLLLHCDTQHSEAMVSEPRIDLVGSNDSAPPRYPEEQPMSDKLKHLLAALKGNDEGKQCQAIEELRLIRDARAVDPLIEILERNASHEPVYYAIQALAAIGTKPAVQALITALERKKGDLSTLAMCLGDLQAGGATDGLIRLLEGGTEYQRRHAAMALGKVGESKGIAPLEKALNDADEGVRERAGEALATLRKRYPAPPPQTSSARAKKEICASCRQDFTGQDRWGLQCARCPAEVCHRCAQRTCSNCPRCGGQLLNSML